MSDVVSQNVTGFVSHLRLNGFKLGPAESELALRVLEATGNIDARVGRLGLKTALCAGHDQWGRFDELFEAYWFNKGRTREAVSVSDRAKTDKSSIAKLWDQALSSGDVRNNTSQTDLGEIDQPEGSGGHGRLIASRQTTMYRRDLREIVDPHEIHEAEQLALKLAQAICINRSRRRRPASAGRLIDLKRTLRASLARGGEPIDLHRRRRPVRPVRLVLLLDVSGSMQVYSRFFLQFAKGLIGQWLEAEAFIFHTRLIKVSDALRERDPFQAMARLSLMTQGIGGGTEIGGSLATFNDRYSAGTLNSRSVVVIMSDGYDSGSPEVIERELARLQRKARRIIWLNPLAGWRDYQPVARAMAAAMPHIDCFAPAGSLEDLAAVEPMLRHL